MKVGYSTQTINPKIGCQMEGYTPRDSTGVHDNLTISSIIIDNTFILMSLDLVAIPGFRVNRIKRKIKEKFGIDQDHIIISAIHTHSGPTVTDLLIDYPKIDEEYWHLIDQQALQSVVNAVKNSKESDNLKLITYHVPEGIYANRNSRSLPYNNKIIELRFLKDKIPIASYILIATHPTVMNVKNTEISADLIHQIRLEYQSINNLVPVIALSDCGDTSTRFTRRASSFSEIKRLGSLINTVLQKPISERNISWLLESMSSIKQICNYDPITNQKANDIFSLIKQKYQNSKCEQEKENFKGLLDTYKHIRYFGHTHFQTKAYVYKFKDFDIVTYPGELVNALGSKIRDASNKPILLITLANDYRGYSVDKEEFGKYFESYNSVFLSGMADEFVNNIVKAIKA